MSVFFFTFEGENYVSIQKIKYNHTVLRKNQVDTNRAPVFAPDYSATA